MKPAISNSHYHDLRQLVPEEDLIDLDSGPPTPQSQTGYFDVPTHQSGTNPPDSDHGLKRYQAKVYATQRNSLVLMHASNCDIATIVVNQAQVL